MTYVKFSSEVVHLDFGYAASSISLRCVHSKLIGFVFLQKLSGSILNFSFAYHAHEYFHKKSRVQLQILYNQ